LNACPSIHASLVLGLVLLGCSATTRWIGADGVPDASVPRQDETLDPDLLPAGAANTGIYLYWTFDTASLTAASDASGNGRNGSLTDAPSPSDRAPDARPDNLRGAFFNGTGATATRELDAPLGAFTVAFWIKPADTTPALVFTRQAAAGDALTRLSIGPSARFEWTGGDADGPCATRGDCVTQSAEIMQDQWVHLAASVDAGGTLQLFVDGRDEGTARRQSLPSELGSIVLGAAVGPPPGVRAGFDELIIYDRALRAADVAALAARN
jgi:hypothetical protein